MESPALKDSKSLGTSVGFSAPQEFVTSTSEAYSSAPVFGAPAFNPFIVPGNGDGHGFSMIDQAGDSNLKLHWSPLELQNSMATLMSPLQQIFSMLQVHGKVLEELRASVSVLETSSRSHAVQLSSLNQAVGQIKEAPSDVDETGTSTRQRLKQLEVQIEASRQAVQEVQNRSADTSAVLQRETEDIKTALRASAYQLEQQVISTQGHLKKQIVDLEKNVRNLAHTIPSGPEIRKQAVGETMALLGAAVRRQAERLPPPSTLSADPDAATAIARAVAAAESFHNMGGGPAPSNQPPTHTRPTRPSADANEGAAEGNDADEDVDTAAAAPRENTVEPGSVTAGEPGEASSADPDSVAMAEEGPENRDEDIGAEEPSTAQPHGESGYRPRMFASAVEEEADRLIDALTILVAAANPLGKMIRLDVASLAERMRIAETRVAEADVIVARAAALEDRVEGRMTLLVDRVSTLGKMVGKKAAVQAFLQGLYINSQANKHRRQLEAEGRIPPEQLAAAAATTQSGDRETAADGGGRGESDDEGGGAFSEATAGAGAAEPSTPGSIPRGLPRPMSGSVPFGGSGAHIRRDSLPPNAGEKLRRSATAAAGTFASADATWAELQKLHAALDKKVDRDEMDAWLKSAADYVFYQLGKNVTFGTNAFETGLRAVSPPTAGGFYSDLAMADRGGETRLRSPRSPAHRSIRTPARVGVVSTPEPSSAGAGWRRVPNVPSGSVETPGGFTLRPAAPMSARGAAVSAGARQAAASGDRFGAHVAHSIGLHSIPPGTPVLGARGGGGGGEGLPPLHLGMTTPPVAEAQAAGRLDYYN